MGGATGAAFNHRGGDFWTAVGRGTLAGVAGGLAGGAAGRYLTSDPIATGMIGGAVGGGIQGAYNHDWLRGAFQGSVSGGLSSMMTSAAYDVYGRILTNKMLGDGAYGEDYAGTPVGFEESVAALSDHVESIEFIEELYDCQAFAKDLHTTGNARGTLFDWSSDATPHYGMSSGRTQYGQQMVLSKIGVNSPIMVKTDGYLSGIYGNYSPQVWDVWRGYLTGAAGSPLRIVY